MTQKDNQKNIFKNVVGEIRTKISNDIVFWRGIRYEVNNLICEK